MAYNVLKGIVEGSVDQHADQEIDGIKVFKSTISASMFYDTDAKSPCATENNVAVKKLSSDTKFGILTYQGEKIAKSNYNLTFDGLVLRTDKAIIKSIVGSGEELKNVPAEHLSGKVQAKSINYGSGLEEYRTELKVKVSEGIKCDDDGLSLNLAPNGALDVRNQKLFINPDNSLNIQDKGQNVSDSDLLLIYDASRGEVRHTTLKNLYDGFVNLKVPHAAGAKNSVQVKGNKAFEGNQNFTYDAANKTVAVKGTTKTTNLQVAQNLESNNKLLINGALYGTIKTIDSAQYMVEDTDNTLLFNTSDNAITVTLPLAKENAGRILTIKKICDDQEKYRIRGSNILKVMTNGELIDFTSEFILKSNYSIRTLQSDGNKWWIINRVGS
tara:strand:- start:2341 stop:3495 length:1155 start_codon:yes stop_codon:yes gene_type:complete